jgi:serine/threonine protein kinase
MSTSQQHAPPPPPDEWPREVRDLYEPIRIIGRGGFACVWMAREKKESSAPTPTPAHVVGGGDDDRGGGGGGGGGEDGKHVAIKIMRDGAYAEREVAILTELSSLARPHPNIVRILRDFKSDIIVSRGGGGTTRCAVLSLERGPTLNFVLTNGGGCGGGGGGSLGLVVARGISRQLIGAVAFLHGHAGEREGGRGEKEGSRVSPYYCIHRRVVFRIIFLPLIFFHLHHAIT